MHADSASLERRTQPPRWSFSLGSLMLLVVMAAIAVATGKDLVVDAADPILRWLKEPVKSPQPFGSNWLIEAMPGIGYVLVVPTAACMAFSLMQHAVVLVIRQRPIVADTLPHKCGWCFDVAVRVLLAALLVICPMEDRIFHLQSEWLQIKQPEIHGALLRLRSAAFLLAMIAALALRAHPGTPSKRTTYRHWIVNALSIPPAVVLCFCVWMWSAAVDGLVYMAVFGIESAQPLKFHDPAAPLLLEDRTAVFWTRAFVASIAAVVCAAACRLLTRSWDNGTRTRMTCAVLLLLGWAVQLWFLMWVYPAGMHQLSPALSESLIEHHPMVYWVVGLALLLLSLLVAYPAARTPPAGLNASSSASRYVYFYESRLALGITTFAALMVSIGYLSIGIDEIGCLWLALFIVCIQLWRNRWQHRSQPRTIVRWDLPPGKFATIWLAVFLTISMAVPVLGLFSFINWFGPWIHWGVFETF